MTALQVASGLRPLGPGPLSRVSGWRWRLCVWLLWVLATTAGWLLGSVAVFAILAGTSGAADAIVKSDPGSALLGAVVGLTTAGLQWLVIRGQFCGFRAWVPVSVGVWAAAWAVGQAVSNALLDDYWLLAFLPGGLLLAASVAIGQWAVLRRYLRHASAWIPASLVGWLLAGIVCMYGGGGLLAAGLASFVGGLGWLLAAAPGVLAGVLTGAVLVGCLRRPAPTS